MKDKFYLNSFTGLVDSRVAAGLGNIDLARVSVVSGDFDNDMDLDIYVVATKTGSNEPNILYENQGNGTFIPVPDAGGAAGTSLGVGDTVTTVDYDLNGFLDLFVTNGEGPLSTGGPGPHGPYELFQNQGNGNNWLQIDLVGRSSNREGIGAQIFATAGGVTQLREQAGGIHNISQNHSRIHFGLAQNTVVSELVVNWTSGIEQIIPNVAPNQILQVVEGRGTPRADTLNGSSLQDTLNGNDGNDLLTGGANNDTLNGGVGNDSLLGGVGSDRLTGEFDNDTLNGGVGNDSLLGGRGQDLLIGGNGIDSFVVRRLNGNNTIRDFEDNRDRLALAGNLTFADLTITQGTVGTIITDTSTNEILATLNNVNANLITATDFTTI